MRGSSTSSKCFCGARRRDPPPSLREVARRLQIPPATLKDACPEACRSLSKKYLAYRQARRVKAEVGLKQILTTDETPPPSVVEAAAGLGEDIKYLYKRFPELCRQITQRRSSCRPIPKTKRRLLDHAKIHRQFAAILAAEEENRRPLLRRLPDG